MMTTPPLSGYVRRITATDPLRWEWCQVKRAVITAKGGAGAEVVAAVTGKKISVLALSFVLSHSAAADVNFDSATTAVYGPVEVTNNSVHVCLPFNEHGWFETAAGAALNVDTGGGTIDGVIDYAEVS